jgi:SPP1 family predicted phage head-tail adaptor
LNPTALKNKILIMEPTYSEGSSGDPILNDQSQWTPVATVWAAYRDLSGNEFFSSQQANSKLTGEFKIRYRPGLKTSYLAVWAEQVYNITAIRDIDGQKQWLYLNVEVVE